MIPNTNVNSKFTFTKLPPAFTDHFFLCILLQPNNTGSLIQVWLYAYKKLKLAHL